MVCQQFPQRGHVTPGRDGQVRFRYLALPMAAFPMAGGKLSGRSQRWGTGAGRSGWVSIVLPRCLDFVISAQPLRDSPSL